MKQKAGFSLKPETKKLIAYLSYMMSVPKSRVIELAIKELLHAKKIDGAKVLEQKEGE